MRDRNNIKFNIKKRILIIGYNFYPEPTGIGKYTGEMVQWLAKKGYDCSVITAYPYYPHWKVQESYFKERFRYKTEIKEFDSGGKITVHRCPMYIPANPTGIKRILLDFSFLISAFFKLLQLMFSKKYDIVITVVPSFQLGLLGIIYKKLHSSKIYYHIQDMQIEAARDLKMIKSERVIKMLFNLEKYILKKSDVISTVSEGMIQKIEKKAKKNVFLLPNWADTNLFYPMENKDKLKEEFGFKSIDKIILYSGAIGEKQGLEAILYSAEELKEMKNFKFIICGSGPYKEKLHSLTEKLKLSNVIFYPLQAHEKFNTFLNIADVHLVIQKSKASDLVMPSKLTNILAVGGLALITANKGTYLHSLVEVHNMGILVDAENPQALNEGILKALLKDNKELIKNARAYAKANLSINDIIQKLESGFSL
jgi:colanic acid biosynthesis glycosyl transferase WcaI